MRLIITFTIILVSLSSAASASVLHYTLGYALGGESFDKVTGGTYSLAAGRGYYVTVGSLIPMGRTSPIRFEAQIAAGYSFDSGDGESGKVRWSSVPIELLSFYRNIRAKYRFGWGVLYQLNPRLKGEGGYVDVSTDIDNVFGFVLAIERQFGESSNIKNDSSSKLSTVLGGVGLRYQTFDYHLAKFNRSLRADGFMITYGVYGY